MTLSKRGGANLLRVAVWCDMVWCDMVWFDMVGCDMVGWRKLAEGSNKITALLSTLHCSALPVEFHSATLQSYHYIVITEVDHQKSTSTHILDDKG